MTYWQIIYYTGEGNYETKEMLINNNQHKQVQESILKGEDFIVIKDKPIIKRTSIASINDAGHIVSEMQRVGIKIDGLLEAPELPQITGETTDGFQKVKKSIDKSHFLFYEKMGWKHKDDCVCKYFKEEELSKEEIKIK